MSPRKNIAQRSEVALQGMHIMFFNQNGLVLDHPMPIGRTVIGQYYYTPLQDKMRPVIHHKQLELLEHGVIWLQDNVTLHRHCDVQNLVHCWGWEVLAHSVL